MERASSTILFNTTNWKWQFGPEMPSERLSHCVTNINTTTSFLAGGYIGDTNLKDAYLFHWDTQRWEKLPDMPKRRTRLSCITYTDKLKKQHVLVVGGETNFGLT